MTCNNKSPPSLSNAKSYTDWLKLIDISRKFTNLEPGKQGPAIVLYLQGEAQDAILELDTTVISGTDGVNKITKRLNRLYKKDELTEKYNALESFETYKRNSSTSVHRSVIFLLNLKNYHKTKSHGTIRSDDLLACRLLKSTKLTIRDEQLVKAAIGALKYDIAKTKLIKSFSDTSNVPTSELTNLNIKPEPTFHAQNHPVDQSPIYISDNGEDFDYQNQELPTESPCGTDYYNDTFFHRNRETK